MSKNHNSATFAAKLRIYSELTNKLPEKVVSMPTKKGVNEMFTPCSISFCTLLLYLRGHLVA